MHDAIVIGARCAGATTAMLLARVVGAAAGEAAPTVGPIMAGA